MVKAVIFDCDGTLLNTLPGIAAFANAALKKIGHEDIEVDKYRYFVGNGRDKLMHRVLAYHNADTEENFQIVGKAYDEAYEKDIMFGTVIYDGICELLENLKKDNIKIGVLTNKPHNVAVQIIKKVFGDIVDVCIGQKPGVPVKPSPEGAFSLVDELGVDVSECVFVGDTGVDIATGKNANMYSIGVLWGFRDKDELGDANVIVKAPSEVYEIVKKLK